VKIIYNVNPIDKIVMSMYRKYAIMELTVRCKGEEYSKQPHSLFDEVYGAPSELFNVRVAIILCM
jgi:hypothetical protein